MGLQLVTKGRQEKASRAEAGGVIVTFYPGCTQAECKLGREKNSSKPQRRGVYSLVTGALLGREDLSVADKCGFCSNRQSRQLGVTLIQEREMRE